MAPSTEENGESASRSRPPAAVLRSVDSSSDRDISAIAFSQWCHQALHVLADQVAFEVQPAAGTGVAKVCALQRLGDQRDLQPAVAESRDREADAVERHRAVLDHLSFELAVEPHPQAAGKAVVFGLDDLRGAVDVALHDAPTEP